MSLSVAYANRAGKNPPVFFTPLDGKARADLFKMIKVYQGLKNLCKPFVGATVLSSLDGSKMAIYEQWKEETDFEEVTDPVAHPEMAAIKQGSERFQRWHEHRNMEFVDGECAPQLLPKLFTRGEAMHLEVFRTQPNRFQALLTQCLSLMKQKLASFSGTFFGFSVHRTLDGTKLCIVGHWRSCADALEGLEGSAEQQTTCPPSNLYTDRTTKIYEAAYVI